MYVCNQYSTNQMWNKSNDSSQAVLYLYYKIITCVPQKRITRYHKWSFVTYLIAFRRISSISLLINQGIIIT